METKNCDLNTWVKRILISLSLLSFIVLFSPDSYKMFGNLAFLLLLVIVFVRPLADIFELTILKKIVCLRKELGIMCASFGIAHGIGYFIFRGLGISSVFTAQYWSVTNVFGWGMFAMLISLPLLLTSNLYSMKLLGKNWKNLQRFTYLFFVLVVLHLIFLKPSDTITLSMLVIAWAVLWMLAYKKVKFENNRYLVYTLFGLIFLGYGFGIYYSGISKPVKNDNSKITISSSSSSLDNQDTSSVTVIKTISINSRCMGCGKCTRIAPDYFEMNYSTHSAQVIKADSYDQALVNKSINNCHAGAISAS